MGNNRKHKKSADNWQIERLDPRVAPWYSKKLVLEHTERYRFAGKYVKDKTVVELGCCTGYGSLMLAGSGAKKVYGIDISTAAVAYAKKHFSHKYVEYFVANAEDTGLSDRIADVVVSFETIEHLPEPEKFLSEVYRIVKRGGIFIISTPNRETSFGDNPYHMKEYTLQELDSLLTSFSTKKYFGQHKVTYSLVMFYKKIFRLVFIKKLRIFFHFRPWEDYRIKATRKSAGLPFLYLLAVCQK
jgi:2-polyprenyl-3-methyl-5-hydroxy-6-metoxy-1,4-benzoquinol methylase